VSILLVFSNASLKQSITKIPVSIAKNLSNVVFAKTFPIVFRKNSIIKNHTAISAALINPGNLNFSDFINIIKKHNAIINNEIISKTNNCSLVSILPPHRKSTGTKSNITIPIIMGK